MPVVVIAVLIGAFFAWRRNRSHKGYNPSRAESHDGDAKRVVYAHRGPGGSSPYPMDDMQEAPSEMPAGLDQRDHKDVQEPGQLAEMSANRQISELEGSGLKGR